MKKELWFKEEVILKPFNGECQVGWRVCFQRFLEEGETIEDIDQSKEYQDLMEGSCGHDYHDKDFNYIDGDVWEIYQEVQELPTDSWEFYIGDSGGYPLED